MCEKMKNLTEFTEEAYERTGFNFSFNANYQQDKQKIRVNHYKTISDLIKKVQIQSDICGQVKNSRLSRASTEEDMEELENLLDIFQSSSDRKISCSLTKSCLIF
jgi:hypothetical protein